MNHVSRNSMIGTFAFLAMVTAPVAFAQSATAETATDPETPAPAAATAPASSGQISWAEVDADKDGNLSKAEVGVVPALAQVFDQADSNADGTLSPQEYLAFVAQAQGAAGAPPTGE